VGDELKIGTPSLADVSVSGKIIEHTKGEKIRVSKFKAKAKYRRVTGFRASLTKIQIESISAKGEKKETKKSEKPAPKSEDKKTS
jgi:large subunit ribosomal protein L21